MQQKVLHSSDENEFGSVLFWLEYFDLLESYRKESCDSSDSIAPVILAAFKAALTILKSKLTNCCLNIRSAERSKLFREHQVMNQRVPNRNAAFSNWSILEIIQEESTGRSLKLCLVGCVADRSIEQRTMT